MTTDPQDSSRSPLPVSDGPARPRTVAQRRPCDSLPARWRLQAAAAPSRSKMGRLPDAPASGRPYGRSHVRAHDQPYPPLLRGARERSADPVHPRSRQHVARLDGRGRHARAAGTRDRLRPARLRAQRAPTAYERTSIAEHTEDAATLSGLSRPDRRSSSVAATAERWRSTSRCAIPAACERSSCWNPTRRASSPLRLPHGSTRSPTGFAGWPPWTVSTLSPRR